MSLDMLERRVLIADDDASLHEAYRRIFQGNVGSNETPDDLDALSAELFGSDDPETAELGFTLSDVVYCRQGEEAVAAVERARDEGKPFSILFLDMRMPPGIDGMETARRVRRIDPDVNIIIVTGYSDYKPGEITAAVGRPERLFYLVKPFNGDELLQLAMALSNRWIADRGVEAELAARIEELERVNAALLASEARAKEIARLDALTGLVNRTGLSEQFESELGRASEAGRQLSVLYLDLDRFKDTNDSLGHHVGDQLIRAFAERIRQATGEVGFAARLGGDEFAVICTHPERLEALTERLLVAGAMPFTLGEHTITTSTSIGIAHSGANRGSLIEVMRCADIALYAAKAAGRGIAFTFEPSMELDFIDTQKLARDLAKAIADDKLALHYQPLVNASTGEICAVEALLRWTHPEQGPIPPLTFVGIAEKTNQISELGDWVIRHAFSDSRRWPGLITAINLSPAQLRDPKFVERLTNVAHAMDVDPRQIELEVTETVLIDDMDAISERICQLKEVGFRIAIDDFGSGYASLAYLRSIPFDKLKIDRSFVQDINLKPEVTDMIRSIVGLAQAMGLTTTAEGVEEGYQREFLRAAGCTQMQGFYFHRPGPADQIEALAKLQVNRKIA